ncbi:MAG: hypothetical protein K6A97_09255 [Lachnospiraceae bacterium]|nr:hypothetical protein [Lachnospiraceae bacterium]
MNIKNKIVSVFTVFALALVGCTSQGPKETVNTDLKKEYVKTVVVQDIKLSLFSSYTVKLSKGNLYYLVKDSGEQSDDADSEMTKLMKVSESDTIPQEVSAQEGWNVSAFDVYDYSDGEYYSFLTDNGAGYTIGEYDSNGQKKSETEIPDEYTKAYPEDMLSIENSKFLILFSDTLVLTSKDGSSKALPCPGEKYDKVLKLKNGDVYVSYEDKGGQFRLAQLDIRNAKLNREVSIDIPGLYLCEANNGILISNGMKVFLFAIEDNSLCEICDLTSKKIRSDTVRAIEGSDTGFNIACCIGVDDVSLNLLRFSEKEGNDVEAHSDGYKYDDEGKRVVYLYSPLGREVMLDSLGGVIDCFNYENPDYSIEVVEARENIDPVFDPQVNPDLVIDELNTCIEQYAEGGYLEDLYPYIDRSENISREDIPTFATDSYEIDGKLYALFNRFDLNVILTNDLDVPEKEMEPHEFIEWLESHGEIYSEAPLDRYSLRLLIFMQIIDNYVDAERKTADFKTESFEKLLSELKECDIAPSEPALISDLSVASGDYNNAFFVKQRVSGLKDLAECEASIGNRLCRIRLISNDNKKSSCFFMPYETAGIYANAECKEGAYAFIEYLMTSRNNGMFMGTMYDQGAKSGLCYTLTSVRESVFSDSLGEIEIGTPNGAVKYEITKTDRELLESLIEDAKDLNGIYRRILGIMTEETDTYFQTDKSAAATAEIIQSRVQNMLDEMCD